MNKPVLVYKIGTSGITNSTGEVALDVINAIAEQLSHLNNTYNIVIVSSGAVGTGKKFLTNYSGKIEERKAAAAIGNPLLLHEYTKAFQQYNIAIAQSLCEREHFSDRNKFLQLRSTYQELWKNNIIPIANENDVVSSFELKFSDNDELATLLAINFNAQVLLIATSTDGLLDNNHQLVKTIYDFDETVMSYVKKVTSSSGLGGMLSKLTYARLATLMGIKVHIFNAKAPNAINDALADKIGTVCIAKPIQKTAKQKWLASASIINGKIIVDDGAKKALLERKSLLAVGVKNIISEFNALEAIEILDIENNTIAIARAKTASEEIKNPTKNTILAHADDIVLL
ncbi:MAG: glutamate 5-kinase [Chitinophagales bacterium]|nr:glutamate 5-kinase [Chitinophagales bacterium]